MHPLQPTSSWCDAQLKLKDIFTLSRIIDHFRQICTSSKLPHYELKWEKEEVREITKESVQVDSIELYRQLNKAWHSIDNEEQHSSKSQFMHEYMRTEMCVEPIDKEKASLIFLFSHLTPAILLMGAFYRHASAFILRSALSYSVSLLLLVKGNCLEPTDALRWVLGMFEMFKTLLQLAYGSVSMGTRLSSLKLLGYVLQSPSLFSQST